MRKKLYLVLFLLLVACKGPQKTAEAPAPSPAPPMPRIPATLAEAEQARRSGDIELFELALQQLTRSSDPAVRRRSSAIFAVYLQNGERWDDALRYYRLALTEYPELAPFLQVRMANVEASRKNFPAAIELAQTVLQTAPETSAASAIRLQLPVFYGGAGDRERISVALGDLSKVRIDELSEPRFVEVADALDEIGRADLAAQLRFRILREYPQGRFVETLYRKLNELDAPGSPIANPIANMDFDSSLDLADRLGRANRYDQALDLLDRTGKRFEKRAADPQFRYLRVSSLFNSRRYEEVTALDAKKDQPYYLAVQLLRARAFWRTDRNEPFLAIANKIIKDFPKSKEAVAAKLLLSKYYTTDERNSARAAAYLKEAIAAGAVGNDGENLWTLAWIHILAGEPQPALDTLTQYLNSYPDADYTSNSLFWSAKMYEKLGNMTGRDAMYQRLISFYPYSYYGYRARQILGLSMTPPAEVLNANRFPDIDFEAASASDPRLRTIDELAAIGLTVEAASEFKRIYGESPENPQLAFRLANLYSMSSEPLRAMGVLQRRFRSIIRHGGTNIPQRFWEILFPRDYAEPIEKAARAEGLDPNLLRAIARQESGYDPTVVSSAGATGLMQIMPAEIAKISARAGLTDLDREDLFDPAVSARLGAAEITQKLEAMKGDLRLAIMAYNAGEDAVSVWTAKTSPSDVDIFIDSIPFNETRLYVKNVIRNYYEYSRIYGGSAASTAFASK